MLVYILCKLFIKYFFWSRG